MHAEVRACFRDAIERVLAIVEPPHATATGDYLVWSRSGASGWSGRTERRRYALGPMDLDSDTLDRLTDPFADVLRRHHPELFRTDSRFKTSLDSMLTRQAVSEAVREIVHRSGTFTASTAALEEILDEFALWVDRPTITYAFVAPVVNLYVDGDPIHLRLPDGTTLRQVTDAEATRLFGGPLAHLAFVSRDSGTGPFDYALFGFYEEDRLWPFRVAPDEAFDGLRERIRRLVVALRTFEAGPVGVSVVWRTPQTFFPLPVSVMPRTLQDEYIPSGSFRIPASRAGELLEHVRALQAELPVALRVACRRLAAAAIRSNSEDRLIDAVIGMEALLLAGIGEKHELRHRFALHYASLFDSPVQRESAFRLARDLYDRRSQIAHGVDPGRGDRFDGALATVAQAADAACEALRLLIRRFATSPERVGLGDATYWLRRVLGLSST